MYIICAENGTCFGKDQCEVTHSSDFIVCSMRIELEKTTICIDVK